MTILKSLRALAWRRIASAAGLAALMLAAVPSAQAVPSYARQTGSECASCHVGGFGPQLTPYGVRFKINGYTDTDGKDGKIPLSAMMVVNATRTAKDAPEAPDHFSANNNSAMQEASLFVAGRLADNIGSFVQVTYSGVDRVTSLDQADIRYARNVKLGDTDAVFGVSLNTNPTLTDPFNTLGQWRFPYTSSDFGFGYGPDGATPKVEMLGGGVMGLNAYTFINDSIYAELGLYNNLSKKTIDVFNTDDIGKVKGLGTYGRVAYFKDNKRDNFSVGLFGFDIGLQDRAAPGLTDRYRDLGIDAQYQYLGNRRHIFTANASFVREWQRMDNLFANGEAANARSTSNQFRAAGSYHYDQTWGGTVAFFDTRGKADAIMYADSYSNRPNTTGYILQADWTPWGKEGSWGNGWANVRLGVQYTGYTRYMGGSSYFDSVNGVDRKARDNNTTMLFLWTSI